MRIRFWGVRGSICTPLSTEQLNEKLFQALSGAAEINLTDPAEVQAYIARLPVAVRSVVGGNTSCVEVDTGTDLIIIDCGSGMRALGINLMAREFGRGQGVAHIFLTHAHWDHLLGFPFFAPAYVPGNKLIFYAVNYDPQRYLEHQQVAPLYFPVPINAMPAEKDFVQLREGETVQIGRTVVSSLALYHPGISYAYRFDDGESIFVFASDGEYKSLAEFNLRRYIDFFSNADALVFDSQYSLRDVFLSKADWGHSSAIIGVDISERARVKRLITFHHDPTHSDEQIHAIAAAARDYALVNQISSDIEIIVGTEGLELPLGQPPGLEIMEDRSDPVWTMALAGQLTQATYTEAYHRLQALLAAAPEGRVILDLTLLTTLDAIALKSLRDGMRAYPQAIVAILAPTLPIRRRLEHLGAAGTFKIFHSRQQALMTLTGPVHLRLMAETIGGQYHLVEMAFVDGDGVVYRGTDRSNNSPVLVRVVPGLAEEPARAAFAVAVEHWQTIHHPGLLPGKALIADEAWLAWVCAQPDGLSLRQWRAQEPKWSDQWQVAEQLCQAVAALHTHAFIHADLRPETVSLSGRRARITRTALYPHPPAYGPAAYRAPEQLCQQPVTPRTDVYALGVILYELLLGVHPFAAESEELRLTLQLHSQPESPRLHWPEIPAMLENFLLTLLAPLPADRYASGQEAALALRAIPLPPETG